MMAPVEKKNNRKNEKKYCEVYTIQRGNQMLQTNRATTIFDEINHHTIRKYFQDYISQ